MEKDGCMEILALGEQLAHEGQVPLAFVDQLTEDLQVPGRLEELQKRLADRSMKQFLKMHMLSAYDAVETGEPVMENRNTELTYEELKKASERDSTSYVKSASKENIMANLVVCSLEGLEVVHGLFRQNSRCTTVFFR